MRAKIARWIVFTILFSLAPIASSYFFAIRGDLEMPPLSVATEHGELFLLSSSFAAVGLGEIIGGATKWEVLRIVVGGLSTILIFLSTLLFASATRGFTPADGPPLITVSYIIFGATCIIATACVALSEVK